MPNGNQRRTLPPCLPGDVLRDGFDFNPSWTERQWDRFFRAKVEYDREWRDRQMRRLAVVSLEIDQAKREAALFEEQEKIDEYHRAEAEENAKLREHFQKALDGPRLKEMLARVEKAGKGIRRDDAYIEREALRRRGVLRGSRR